VGVDGGVEALVDALMDINDERLLPGAIKMLGDKGIQVQKDRVGGTGGLLVLDVGVGLAGVLILIDVGYVAKLLIPHQIIDVFEQDILPGGVWGGCGRGSRGWHWTRGFLCQRNCGRDDGAKKEKRCGN